MANYVQFAAGVFTLTMICFLGQVHANPSRCGGACREDMCIDHGEGISPRFRCHQDEQSTPPTETMENTLAENGQSSVDGRKCTDECPSSKCIDHGQTSDPRFECLGVNLTQKPLGITTEAPSVFEMVFSEMDEYSTIRIYTDMGLTALNTIIGGLLCFGILKVFRLLRKTSLLLEKTHDKINNSWMDVNKAHQHKDTVVNIRPDGETRTQCVQQNGDAMLGHLQTAQPQVSANHQSIHYSHPTDGNTLMGSTKSVNGN
ncbi:uncharacterized protein LOC144451002 [Glandiceps talaboti]